MPQQEPSSSRSNADHAVLDSPEALFHHLYEEHGVEEARDFNPETHSIQFWMRRHAELERAQRTDHHQSPELSGSTTKPLKLPDLSAMYGNDQRPVSKPLKLPDLSGERRDDVQELRREIVDDLLRSPLERARRKLERLMGGSEPGPEPSKEKPPGTAL